MAALFNPMSESAQLVNSLYCIYSLIMGGFMYAYYKHDNEKAL